MIETRGYRERVSNDFRLRIVVCHYNHLKIPCVPLKDLFLTYRECIGTTFTISAVNIYTAFKVHSTVAEKKRN